MGHTSKKKEIRHFNTGYSPIASKEWLTAFKFLEILCRDEAWNHVEIEQGKAVNALSSANKCLVHKSTKLNHLV